MALDFLEDNIFKHSKDFEQGGGKIRKGQSSYTVALDGSGDFAGIQEAINALPASGGNIFIKEGIYNLTTALTIKSNMILEGCGKGTQLIAKAEITIISGTGISNTTIRNLYLYGFTSAAEGMDNAIYVTGMNITVNNNYIEHVGQNGILIDGNYSIFKDNFITNCAFGMQVWNATGGIITGNVISSCFYGIYTRTCTNTIITGNYARGFNTPILLSGTIEIGHNNTS